MVAVCVILLARTLLRPISQTLEVVLQGRRSRGRNGSGVEIESIFRH